MPYYKADTSRAAETQKALEEEAARRGINYWKPKEGDNRVRVLPPWTDQGEWGFKWWREWWIHFNVGPDSRRFACPKKLGVGPCYICEQVAVLRDGDETDKDMAGDLAAGRQYYINIIDLKEPKNDDGTPKVQLYTAGITVFKEMVDYFCDPQWGDFSDPEDGFVVVIKRTGTGKKNTRYSVRLDKNRSKLEQDLWPALDSMNDLDLVLPVEEYSALQAAYQGVAPEQVTAGAPASAGALPPASPSEAPADDAFDFSTVEWGSTPMTRPEVAAKVGLEADDIPECYGFPDKYEADDEFCQNCAVFKPCGTKATAPADPPKKQAMRSKAAKPEPEPEPEGDSDADLEAKMKAALATKE